MHDTMRQAHAISAPAILYADRKVKIEVKMRRAGGAQPMLVSAMSRSTVCAVVRCRMWGANGSCDQQGVCPPAVAATWLLRRCFSRLGWLLGV